MFGYGGAVQVFIGDPAAERAIRKIPVAPLPLVPRRCLIEQCAAVTHKDLPRRRPSSACHVRHSAA